MPNQDLELIKLSKSNPSSVSSATSSNETGINSSSSYSQLQIYTNMKLGEKCGSDGASTWTCEAGLKCDTGDSVNTGVGVVGICSASCSSTGCN